MLGDIREYQEKDKPSLLRIFQANTPLYFDPVEQKHFETYLQEHPETYFVIEKNGKIIGGGGYILCKDKRVGRITWNLIHPDYSHRGFGYKIVSYCLDMLRNIKSVRLIRVCTSQFAHKFYSRFGFNVIDVREDFWAPGLDLYKMEMEAHRRA